MAVIKSEFFLALNQVASDRGISVDDVLNSIKAAVLAAYKKDYDPDSDTDVLVAGEEVEEKFRVELNQESGEMHIFEEDKDITPPGFGRIAAQTARQVILQQIREAEKRTIVQHYTGQVGTMVKGRVIRFDGRNVLIDMGKAEGTLPPEEQIRSERYRLNDTLTVYIAEIREDSYGNSRIILSRSHPELVKQLFAKEVPEIESGTVQIKGIAREAGERTKIAVHSDQNGVDPVGACVGQKGIRVKSVTDELGGAEKIDIIQFNADDAQYIREALSPATIKEVELDKEAKRVVVTVDEDQAPLAIGRGGVNVNLASRLTGYEIDIKQLPSENPTKDTDEKELPEEEVAVVED
jgi:transcription termination/antitermination protein NusA